MKEIINTKFSKIGTNPWKYFYNYKLHLNRYHIGEEFEIEGFDIYYKKVSIFNCNSDATFRQNIDAWVWMGFVIKIDNKKIIKIIDENLSEEQLINHIKISILLENKNKLINQHRNTILIKLITKENKSSIHPNYTYEEIKKETGKFENKLYEDKKYMQLINLIWKGEQNE